MLDSIFKSGQATDIVAILSKYDDEEIVAINKILDKDAVAALIRDCGDDGVRIAAKGENRIKALSQNEFSVYIDGEEYSFLSSELKDVRSYVFRINADTPELRIAVEDCLEQLRILYPDYNFSAVYGG